MCLQFASPKPVSEFGLSTVLSAAELVGASNSDAPVAAPTERVGVVLKLGEVGFATITRKVHLAQTLARAIKPRQTGDATEAHTTRAQLLVHVEFELVQAFRPDADVNTLGKN